MTLNPRIRKVVVERPYTVVLTFDDGTVGRADLSFWIVGRNGVFAALQDPEFFARVSVDSDAGTIVWPNGADLDPDVLYEVAHAAVPSTRGVGSN